MAHTPTIEEQRKFYTTFWNNSDRLSIDEKCRRRFVLAAVAEFAKAQKNRLRILDAGCGRGWMVHDLSRYGEVLGIDIFVDEAKKRYPDVRFQEMDIVSEFPNSTYDIVVSSETIEHLPREHQAEHMRRIASVVRPGGMLVLTTPNRGYLEALLRKTAGTAHMQPIESWLSRAELETMAQPYFSIEKVGSVRFYPLWLFSHILLRAPYHVLYDYCGLYRLIDPILQRMSWGTYITLVAKKI